MKDKWLRLGVEPSVRELMADPIFALLLRRDGLHIDEVRRLVDTVRRRLLRQ